MTTLLHEQLAIDYREEIPIQTKRNNFSLDRHFSF